MNTKHTRGPWHWDSDPIKGDSLGRVRYRVTALGKTVTQCYYSSSDECAEYDARLIAAAPELLAALRALLDEAEQFAKAIPPYSSSEAIASARAVIKKATGDAP